MLCLFLVASLSAAAAEAPDFAAFKLQYEKVYHSDREEERARECYMQNHRAVEQLNKEEPHATFAMGATSDLCESERAERLGLRDARNGGLGPMPQRRLSTKQPPFVPDAQLRELVGALPADFDWQDQGAVGPALQQGRCGSCWAFSAVGAMEGAHFLWGGKNGTRNGTLTALSQQELIGCDHFNGTSPTGLPWIPPTPSPDSGCGGGWPSNAFQWVAQQGGIVSAEDYPYKDTGAGSHPPCDAAKAAKAVQASFPFHHDLAYHVRHNETLLQLSLHAFGPLSITIGLNDAFSHYKSGVITKACHGWMTLGHAVLLVGYGSQSAPDGSAVPYWRIRNSEGTSYGEDGFLKIQRGVDCIGVAETPTLPLVAAYPNGMCYADCEGEGECCYGDCCPDDHTCCGGGGKGSGGCASPSEICCGSEGGNEPCGQKSQCCGGQCCDGEDSSCLPGRDPWGHEKGNVCCPKELVCGTGSGAFCMVDMPPGTTPPDYCCTGGFSCPYMAGRAEADVCCPNATSPADRCCVIGSCTTHASGTVDCDDSGSAGPSG
jgi:cathepsin F